MMALKPLNGLQRTVAVLAVVTTVVAWKAMAVVAVCTGLFALYFCAATAPARPPQDDDDTN